MYVGLKQPRGDGERCVTPARAAAKETNHIREKLIYILSLSQRFSLIRCEIIQSARNLLSTVFFFEN